MGMFDNALSLIGPEPKPISNDEYRTRQNKLFSQFEEDDLLITLLNEEHLREFKRPFNG